MHSPERICEALAWLYGVEFRNGEAPQYWATDSSVHVWFRESDGKWLLDQDHWDEDITAEVEHALAVTAPWEWKDLRGTSVRQAKGEHFMACVGRPDSGDGPFCFSVHAEDIRLSETGFDDIEQAQTAARAAYLTWMRGRFAMKGCVV